MKMPKASTRVLATQVGDEVLLMEPDTGKLHNLNATAAIVWGLSDGCHSRADVAQQLADHMDLPLEAADELVAMTLADLCGRGLVSSCFPTLVGRREFLRRWGTVAAVLPLLVSVTTPAAASSASTCPCPTAVPTLNLAATCASGTRTHTWDLSASTHPCMVCAYAVDVGDDGTFEFSSATQSVFNFTFTGSGTTSVTFRVQGPCGAADIATTTMSFDHDCP